MNAKSFLKIWLLYVNIEKFGCKNLSTDQSQDFKRSAVIGPSKSFRDEFLIVNGQQQKFSKWLCLHSLSPL